jgi:hypothetical protein
MRFHRILFGLIVAVGLSGSARADVFAWTFNGGGTCGIGFGCGTAANEGFAISISYSGSGTLTTG